MAMAEHKPKHEFQPPTGDAINSILQSGDRLVNDGRLNKDFLQEIHRVDSSTTVTVSKLQKDPTFIGRVKNGPPLQLEIQIDEELDNLIFRTKYLVFKRSRKKFDLKMRTYIQDNNIIPENNVTKVKHDELSKKKKRKVEKLRMKNYKVSNTEALALNEDLKRII
jgi:hypothetical protein